ncbi:MAG: class I SAM-dependent methyltransferase [Candidatus Omnitrophica bacterium]|nr:class I SAM-dependent methyltransferase [Candidatus Omnitrophota bacterium]
MENKMTLTYLDLLEESLPESTHPAYSFWKNYALNAIDRGEEIVEAINKHASIKDKKVLDVGCGEGGTSIAFAKAGAKVIAIDIDEQRVKRTRIRAQEYSLKIEALVGDINKTDFPDNSFDAIICQDVIEHVLDPEKAVGELGKLLKKGGYLFLTAPNRLSLINFLRDPHYNLFGISLFPKRLAQFYAVKVRKRTASYGVGVLPTLNWLKETFNKKGISLQIDPSSGVKIRNFFQIQNSRKKRGFKIFFRKKLICFADAVMKKDWYQFFIAPNWKLIGVKNKNV